MSLCTKTCILQNNIVSMAFTNILGAIYSSVWFSLPASHLNARLPIFSFFTDFPLFLSIFPFLPLCIDHFNSRKQSVHQK